MSTLPQLQLLRRVRSLVFCLQIVVVLIQPLCILSSSEPPYLKDPSEVLVQSISSTNTLIDSNGREISLSDLRPYTGLFSPGSFIPVNDGRSVQGRQSTDLIEVTVYRGETEDGSTILVSKPSEDVIGYVVVAGANNDSNQQRGATHFIPQQAGGGTTGPFWTVADEDYDYDTIARTFDLGDEHMPSEPATTPSPVYAASSSPPTRSSSSSSKKGKERGLGRSQRGHAGGPRGTRRPDKDQRLLQDWNYVNGDGSSDECTSFLVVPVTIFFDAEFCQLYGGEILNTVSTVQMIVATASLHWENNLCARFELTGIYWDTISCNPENSIFKDFDRTSCSTYLDDVTAYLNEERSGLGIDSNSYIHVFTGLPVTSSGLGCAWLPGPCGSEFVYGVNYMSFQFPDIRGAAFILAHELGHNLNAPHDPNTSERPDYIMEQSFNSGVDGFSPASQSLILNALLDPLNFCVSIESAPTDTAGPTPSPLALQTSTPTMSMQTSPPTPFQTRLPSLSPTSLPTTSPTPVPSFSPTRKPTISPTLRPSASPTQRPTTKVPSLQPTSLAPSQQPTTVAPSPFPTTMSPTPRPTTSAPVFETCIIQQPLIDPVCVDAIQNETGYTCFNTKELLAFTTSSPACDARVELSVGLCTDSLLVYPGSIGGSLRRNLNALGESDAYEDDDEDAEHQRRLFISYPTQFRPLKSEESLFPIVDGSSQIQSRQAPVAPSCNQACNELDEAICFQSTTEPGFDRWYRVRYTVFDPIGMNYKIMSAFVVIKENGQSECSSDNLFTCDDA